MERHYRSAAGMRIRILTPIDEHSAIAAKSLIIAEELSKYADVDVVGEPTESPRLARFPIHPYPPSSLLPAPDFWLVALGNSGFHKSALHFVLEQPSVVMLHDLSLFGAASVEVGTASMSGSFGHLIHTEYGPAAHQSAALGENSRAFGYDTELSFLRRYLRKARGVITHSEYAAGLVRKNTVAPVRMARLPMTEPTEVGDRKNPTLMSLGHVNDNRSMPFIFQALSLLPSDQRPTFRIVGPVSPVQRSSLESLADRMGIRPWVHFTGRVTETALRKELASASLFVNLRNPILEAASDSLLRQMAGGAPVIVYDHGCYSEVPDDTVVKLALAAEPRHLASELGRLLRSESLRNAIGTSARNYVDAHHGVGQYVEVVLSLLQEVQRCRPRSEMVHRVGESMQSIGLLSDDAVVQTIAATESFLFGTPPSKA
jgi:glycosyltransferase involved in cell wall biosynthesis